MNFLDQVTRLPPAVWQASGTVIAAAIAGLAARRSGRATTAAQSAQESAEGARLNAEPVSNGFAPTVLANLEQLQVTLGRVQERADDHAAMLQSVTQLLGQHLQDHTTRRPRHRWW